MTSLKINDYIKIHDGGLKDLLGVLAGSSYTTIITLVVTRTRLPEREGNEIEIHGTWIQYRCVRPGTVDPGFYQDTRENWKSGYRILVYLKYPDTEYRGSRNAIIRLRETTVIGILLCYLPGYALPH